jgi:carboxyl-terminal processing protease
MKKALLATALILAAAATAHLLASGPSEESASAGLPLLGARDSSSEAAYSLSSVSYFVAAAEKVTNEYVDTSRVDPEEMLDGALGEVARRVPEFVWSRSAGGPRTLRLQVGANSEEIPVPALAAIRDLVPVVGQVATFLDEHLPAETERPAVEYGLINGMLSTLDPHSVFIEPEEYAEMEIHNKGYFGGLGITIGLRDRRLTILYPLKGTPAARANLKAGDRIDKIDNESTVNMSLEEAVKKLRGPEESNVTITVSHEEEIDREVSITRARIEVPVVEWAYAGDGIGYIQIVHFAQQTFDKLEEAIADLEKKAIADKQGELRGLVLDLRDNPGGYLKQATEVADEFLDRGVIVTTKGLGGTDSMAERANSFGGEADVPLVVLVDEASASASEIVAGALKNNGRAVVVGVQTFGKGSVQNLYDKEFNAGALKLTVAQYYTPPDESIQGVGISPDVELRPAIVRTEKWVEKKGQQATKKAVDPPEVALYWQDFELREQDLERAFAWGTAGPVSASMRAVYACDDCRMFDTREQTKEEEASDHLLDPEVVVARALLLAAPDGKRETMLKAAPAVLKQALGDREARLQQQLLALGIDWSPAPAGASNGTPGQPAPARVDLDVGSPDGMLTPGVTNRVTLSVTNTGDKPIFRLRAVTARTDGEDHFFEGREFLFGRVDPGQTQKFTVKLRPFLGLDPSTEEVTWHFFADGGPAPRPFVGRMRIREVPRPRFAFSWQLVDDGSGTSKGNGDGLLQPGEEPDLLVTVQNAGNGPTADLWYASLPTPAEEAEEWKEKGSAFAQIRNKSGEAIFLLHGNENFRLQAGESHTARLHFRVAQDLGDRRSLDAEILCGDEGFYEFVESRIEIPVFTASDAIASLDRTMRPKSESVAVRSGASELTPVVATAEGPVQVDGRLGSWMRTSLPWGGSGWLAASDLAPAGRNDKPVPPKATLSHSPPVIQLAENPGGSVTVSPQLSIGGEVLDDGDVKDFFVFVNGRKVSYEPVKDGTGRWPFQLTVDLRPGENRVEIYARDQDDHRGGISLGVYRETATAAVSPPASEAAPADRAVR